MKISVFFRNFHWGRRKKVISGKEHQTNERLHLLDSRQNTHYTQRYKFEAPGQPRNKRGAGGAAL
jgi:hypothetical protein